jgi:hypothetical protein
MTRTSMPDELLTPRKVQERIAAGAKPRSDLSAVFEQTLGVSAPGQALVYELDDGRYLVVSPPSLPRPGGGRILTADALHRFVGWVARVEEDAKHGRSSSVAHWASCSSLKEELVSHVQTLVGQLRSRMGRTPDELDLSSRSLDLVSQYVEGVGVEQAQREIYDHLVAYVGEVMRLRIDGRWEVNRNDRQPHPYLLSEQCYKPLMPINVVWEQLSGLQPVNLRRAATSEVDEQRRPRAPLPAAAVPAAAPLGALAAVPGDAYEVQQRYDDGRPWVVVFTREVMIGGIACQGRVLFHRRGGEAFGLTLARDQSVGGRRFSAGTYIQYLRRQSHGQLCHVELGEDQELDGLLCRRGVLIELYANQRLRGVTLAGDCEIDGIPCAAGNVTFTKSGRVSVATLAREHVVIGRAFPPRAQVYFDEKGRLFRAWFPQDWEIDGYHVKALSLVDFDPDGRLRDYSVWALEGQGG